MDSVAHIAEIKNYYEDIMILPHRTLILSMNGIKLKTEQVLLLIILPEAPQKPGGNVQYADMNGRLNFAYETKDPDAPNAPKKNARRQNNQYRVA